MAGTTRAGFHEGAMFLVAARVYRGLFRSLLEVGQNGIDACSPSTGSVTPQPRIVIAVNHKTREAVALDNGAGATRKQFDVAISKLGMSQKVGALGRWGLGVASPTTECDTYQFCSWARADGRVRRWTFREEDIAPQEKLHIPWEELSELPEVPAWLVSKLDGEFAAEWRTMVHMRNLKRDRQSSAFDPQEFIIEMQTRFSIAMRKLNVLVRLVYVSSRGKTTVYDINPMEFVGEPLDPISYESPETGKIDFELRLAPEVSGETRGIVIVMRTGDNTAVRIHDVSRQALSPGNKPTEGLRKALAALRSGRFAGEIRAEKLALDMDRGMFAPGDGVLNTLYAFLEQWYHDVGWYHFELADEEARDRRWAEAVAAGQQGLTELLNQPQYANLLDSLSNLLTPQSSTSARVAGGGGEPSGEQGGQGGEKPEKKGAKEQQGEKTTPPDGADSPETGGGTREGRRQGLALHIVTEASRQARLWTLDFPTDVSPLTLRINTGHAIWGHLDGPEGARTARNRRWLEALTGQLGLLVVATLAHFPDPVEFETRRGLVDDVIRLFADDLVKRDSSTRRQSTDERADDDQPEDH